MNFPVVATRLTLAKARIERVLDECPTRVLRSSEVHQIYLTNRAEWRLPKSLNLAGFMEFLLQEDILREQILKAPPYREEVRYVRGGAISAECVSAGPGHCGPQRHGAEMGFVLRETVSIAL